MQKIILPLWILCLFISIAQASEIIFSSALCDLSHDLDLDTNIAQLCSAFYLGGFTVGVFSFGRLSDLIGRRPAILLGIMIYCISSCVIITLNNIYLIIIARIFQAIGVSACSIIPQAIARDCYRGLELAKIYNIISIILCFSPMVASTIGGFIVEHYSWRYNVAFLIFLGGLLLAAGYLFLPETIDTKIVDQKTSFFSVLKLMLADKKIMTYTLMAGCSIAVLIGFVIEYSVTFVKYLNMSPSNYGLLNFFISIAMFLGTMLNMRLIAKKYDTVKIIKLALLVSMFGCALVLLISVTSLILDVSDSVLRAVLICGRTVHGVGHIIIMPYILSDALKNYQNVIGSASAIFNGIYYIIITLIMFLVSILHSDTSVLGFGGLMFAISIINIYLFSRLSR